jgi:hypothetical protein
MAVKIVAFLSTLAIDIIAGVLIFFIMLIGLNGYQESDAQWGLLAYIILAPLTAIAMSTGAVFTVNILLKKKFSGLAAGLVAILALTALGILLEILWSVAGILIADIVRVNF